MAGMASAARLVLCAALAGVHSAAAIEEISDVRDLTFKVRTMHARCAAEWPLRRHSGQPMCGRTASAVFLQGLSQHRAASDTAGEGNAQSAIHLVRLADPDSTVLPRES